MELKHIALPQLSVSAANMRAKGKTPDIANILPSVRARGVLVPLIVRAWPCSEPAEGGAPDAYEIVAGKRRFHAALAVATETGEAEPLPCAVIAAGDDAAALEASLIENIARLDPDEVTRWETFTRLVREGRRVEDIAQTFGLTDLQVRRTLALGNLMPRIRSLYRRGEIQCGTVRQLTLATKQQQRDWLALYDDPSAYCPAGQHLKAWLFGGSSIPVSAALFDVATFDGEIVSDLFGDERYFADATAFWTAQTAAIEAKAQSCRDAGWAEVIVLPTGGYFSTWEYQRTPKRKGGKVYIEVGDRGEVTVHEGYVTLKEARRQERGGEGGDRPLRPEMSAPLRNYLDLHRHAAVRAKVAVRPDIALRLLAAHAIAGSPLWQVAVEPQRAATDAIAESVETSQSETALDERRRAVLALLGFDAEALTVVGGYDGEHGVAGLFARLLPLPDAAVRDVLAVVMAETLAAGDGLVDLLGGLVGLDMTTVWQADDAMLDLIRERELLDTVLTEVAGETVAAANAKATGKVKRQIVRDCLTGSNGRAKVEGWTPRWLAFPPTGYTGRGGLCPTSPVTISAPTDTNAAPVRLAA